MIIKNVTVIDGTGSAPRPGMDVTIADGCFTDIRPTAAETAAAPGGHADDQVIDGRGHYLALGLWESHTHLTGHAMALPEAERVPHVRQQLADYLKAGITSVCDLGGSAAYGRMVREAGQPGTAARLFYAGPCFTGPKGWPLQVHGDRTMALETGSAEDARRAVQNLVGQVDFVKCIFDGKDGQRLPPAALEVIVAEAHTAGKKVLAHVATGTDVRDAVHAGVDAIEHAFVPQDPADLSEAEQAAALMAEAGTLFCPTVVTWEQLGHSGDRAHLDRLVADGIITAEEAAEVAARPSYGKPFPHHPADESRIRFEYAMRTLPLFHDAGVKLVAGSDIALVMPTPASALLRELQLFAQAGLPGLEIIAAATGRAAEKVGKHDAVGTVTVGAAADAVLLDADPLKDISHLIDPQHHRAIISAGRLAQR
ncbi:amidohydrolase family protein [Streptomyces sp. NPDC001037]|uniref:amidohydrolase family protein n=1 Tax=Streptomyces sp. NPDC001037 TaxID=3364542 RepID=UPI0036C16563